VPVPTYLRLLLPEQRVAHTASIMSIALRVRIVLEARCLYKALGKGSLHQRPAR
jgi:hypothetical protein